MRFRHRERPGFQHGKRDVLVCDLQVDERAPGRGFLSLRKLAIDQAISAGFDEAMIATRAAEHRRRGRDCPPTGNVNLTSAGIPVHHLERPIASIRPGPISSRRWPNREPSQGISLFPALSTVERHDRRGALSRLHLSVPFDQSYHD